MSLLLGRQLLQRINVHNVGKLSVLLLRRHIAICPVLLIPNFRLRKLRVLRLRARQDVTALRSQSVSTLLFHPVEVVVIFKTTAVEQIFEDGAQAIVVWPLLKLDGPHLLHVGDKLGGNLVAELWQSHFTFFPADHFILLFLVHDFDTLPGQVPPHEVDQHEAKALKVVPS